MKVLIIPDVHGRPFWKKAYTLIDSVDKIVFLGDYVDPYDFEHISKDDAIKNFEEIIEFAKNHQDKVVLLFGNHCLHYVYRIFKENASGGRLDRKHYTDIKQKYLDNLNLFKLAFDVKDNDTHYLLSHAGVCSEWYELHKNIIGELTSDNLNTLLESDKGIQTLCDIGYSRWGNERVGSIVWADVDDHLFDTDSIPFYQIFGHTQQMEKEIIKDKYACLDVRKCFMLNNGNIKPIENE